MPALTATLRPVSSCDEGDEVEDALERALVGAAHGEHDAELGRAEGGGLAGGGEDLVTVEEGRRLDRRVEARGLRAEVAVLGAAAGLGREDALDLDLGAAPGEAHLVGQRGEVHDGAVGQCGQRGELVAGQEAALVEEGPLGSGDHGPVRRTQGDLGRGRRAVRMLVRGRVRGAGDRKATGVVVTAPTVVAGWGPPTAEPDVGGRGEGAPMAWDFSTEPEFEEKLAWMRGFVREEVFPLETLDLTYDQVREVIRPLQERVKAEGLWAAHLPPALGGMGFGQVRLGLMHEILGQSPLAPVVFGNNAPDSGNAELLAVGIEETGDEEMRAKWLQPLLDGDLRSAFSMTEPNTAGSDPTLLSTSAVRDGDEWVINGHKWFTSNGSVADFLIVMAVTNPDVHPYQGSSMIIVPVVDTRGGHRPGRRDDGGPRDAVRALRQPRRDRLHRRAGAGGEPDRARGVGVRAGAEAARVRGGSTTACAGWGSRGGPSTCCASVRCRATRTARRWPRSRRSRTGSPTPWPRCRRRV